MVVDRQMLTGVHPVWWKVDIADRSANRINPATFPQLARYLRLRSLYDIVPRSSIDLILPGAKPIPGGQYDAIAVLSSSGRTLTTLRVDPLTCVPDSIPHSYTAALVTRAGSARSFYSEFLPALCAGYHHMEEV